MKERSISLVLILAIVLVVNLLSDQYFFRLDLTEDGQYTLSQATKDILQELEEPVTVTAYFSEDLPPDIAKTRKDFEDLLVEYARLSDNNLIFRFVNPNEDEESQQKAVQAGVRPVLVNIREKDQIKQQKAFLGAVLELGEAREVIPFVEPGGALEYSLSSSIKKMAVLDKPQIAFLQGQGQPELSELSQVHDALKVLYEVESFTLTDSTAIPGRFETVALVNPADSLSEQQMNYLDEYLTQGGNLFIALNRVEGNLQRSSASSINTGLETWLKSRGLEVENALLTDAESGSITVQQQQGMFRLASQVQFPYLPIVTNFADHPVTKGLEALLFEFVSPLKYAGSDSTTTFTPLVLSSGRSGKQRVPLQFDIQKQWAAADFPLANQPVAGLLERTEENGNTSRLIVIGDADFAINGPAAEQKQLPPDQVNLMVNAIDWLSDDTGLIDLRNKGVSYRPIMAMEDSTKSLLKYLNFFAPLLLLSAYGLLRFQRNRSLRTKRMEEDYA